MKSSSVLLVSNYDITENVKSNKTFSTMLAVIFKINNGGLGNFYGYHC